MSGHGTDKDHTPYFLVLLVAPETFSRQVKTVNITIVTGIYFENYSFHNYIQLLVEFYDVYAIS